MLDSNHVVVTVIYLLMNFAKEKDDKKNNVN